ncbi:MAG: hypothetical protein M1829_003804 [Trizodia sp. TS-e1964]|nr:MAG: hypothetical protein M1829_003804 [Trizodia sp. TS-e1964]
MARGIDYSALRALTMGSGENEEAVTINTRALIDKVLARYSAEWTVLRELIQNAADASASKVTVRFDTLPSPTVPAPKATDPSSILQHVLLHHKLSRLLVTNNGTSFADSDWTRLKRIAEGNPDETKIGAFGVGFYSVFADCEEPFVSSGKEAMAFYWKENSLFTRRLRLPEATPASNTSFVLDYRSKTSRVPPLLPLCQFLATSLAFVGVQEIDLWIDDWNVLSLQKKTAPGIAMAIPKDLLTTTAEGLLNVRKVESENVQIDARFSNAIAWKFGHEASNPASTNHNDSSTTLPSATSLRSFFSRLTSGSSNLNPAAERISKEETSVQKAILEDLMGTSTSTIFLRIATAQIVSSVNPTFAAELLRATKKPPPKLTKLAILTSSFEEMAASTALRNSSSVSAKAIDIFTHVLPSKTGKIFIGFPTSQTSGLSAHISAHSVVPTVERESIDLNARWVRTWNKEMLRASGIVCRIIYSSQMSEISQKVDQALALSGKSKIGAEEVTKLLPEVIHNFKQFSFNESTPNSQVGQIIEEAFWVCHKKPSIEVFSSQGVLQSYQVRCLTAGEDVSGFVAGLPILPEQLISGAPQFVKKIRDYGLVTEITINDIRKELEAKALDSTQLVAFLRWAGEKTLNGSISKQTAQGLLSVTIGTHESNNNSGSLLILDAIKFYYNPSRIPGDMPAPPDTIPFALTAKLSKKIPESFGWEELQIVPWLRYILENAENLGPGHDMTRNPKFAAQVLPILSKQWESQPNIKSEIISLLSNRTIIPSKHGLKIPNEAYFPSVKMFDDLSVIIGLNGVKERFLVALGVRKTIELNVIFERLISAPTREGENGSHEARWGHVDLIKYLASVRDDIPAGDLERLRNTSLCPIEVDSNPQSPSIQKFKISVIYEPKDDLRALNLPLLQWPGIYRSSSNEGTFLTYLGLRSFPPVTDLIELIAISSMNGNLTLRDRLMSYFIANHHLNNYDKFNAVNVKTPYLPVQGADYKVLLTPDACFTNQRASLLGFPILRSDLHIHASKFGVKADPPINECINRLVNSPPQTISEGSDVFAYFAERLSEINPSNIEYLGKAQIVPILPMSSILNGTGEKHSKKSIRYASPQNCYLGDSSSFREIFDFVEFGPESRKFLLAVGSRHEPGTSELAQVLVKEPVRLLSALQSPEKYLQLLEGIAANFSSLKKDKTLLSQMKRAPFLLAYKMVPKVSSGLGDKLQKALLPDEDNNDDHIREWKLVSATEIILVDDILSYSLFKDKLFAAPQEDTLEQLYWKLGSQNISSILEKKIKVSGAVHDQTLASDLAKRVFERSRLFLHDIRADSIKHDTKSLEKNLQVIAVETISLRRTLRLQNISHTEKRTASLSPDSSTLWITAKGFDMFEVSRELVSLMLHRPKTHSAVTFEMLLATDLLKLRSRGFNVDRILQRKALEARMAEEEIREKIQSKPQETEAMLVPPKAENRSPKKDLKMPGSFIPDSPEQQDVKPPKQGHGFFENIRESLLGRGQTAPRSSRAHAPAQHGNKSSTVPNDPTALNEDNVQKALDSAINACRPHNSASVFAPPKVDTIEESATYCDNNDGKNLSLCGKTTSGLKIFLQNISNNRFHETFFSDNQSHLNRFADILTQCGRLFGLPADSLHIFYDKPESSRTIAFNLTGSVFCNFRFFQDMHLPKLLNHAAEGEQEALVYWWIVISHELAHNLVKDHSSAHGFHV